MSQIRLEPYAHPHSAGDWRLLVVPMGVPGSPVIRLPVRLDELRPPEGAQIKGCRVVRRGRWWHAVLSIAAPPPELQAGEGTLYAGLNWRLQADGSIRILDGVGDDGVRYRVSLPHWQVAAVRYGDELQGALDRRANEAAARLAEALPERAGEIRDAARRKRWADLYALDPVLADGTHGRRGREHHEALLAARRRVGSDPEKYASAVAEILGDRIGRQRLEAHRSKALRRREHLYRACARWIAERFERVVLAKSDGAKLARVEDPETGEHTALPLPARRQRQAAAPYSLQQAIRWAMAKAGADVVDAPAANRSRTCPLCGRRTDAPGREGELYLHCAEHGRWDRDHALAVSLWADEVPAEERERWGLALRRGERSRVQIVRIDAEVEQSMGGDRQAYSRRRYVAGEALADRRES